MEQQAAVEEANAEAADNEATDAIRRGRREGALHRLQVGQAVARQTAALAANGVVTTEGSALGLLADTELMGEVDAETIRGNTSREVFNITERGRQLRANASMSRNAARRINPGMATFATLAGGATQYAVADQQARNRRSARGS